MDRLAGVLALRHGLVRSLAARPGPSGGQVRGGRVAQPFPSLGLRARGGAGGEPSCSTEGAGPAAWGEPAPGAGPGAAAGRGSSRWWETSLGSGGRTCRWERRLWEEPPATIPEVFPGMRRENCLLRDHPLKMS